MEPLDVFMAPHHGSRLANTPRLIDWSKPKLVVACQGFPHGPPDRPDVYTAAGIPYWGTWPNGAITIHSDRAGLTAETYKTRKRMTIRKD
jgi:competence protein ComEC